MTVDGTPKALNILHMKTKVKSESTASTDNMTLYSVYILVFGKKYNTETFQSKSLKWA